MINCHLRQYCHLCNHEVVIDVLQVAITTRTNRLVQFPELGVESGELLPDGKKKYENLYFGQGLCLCLLIVKVDHTPSCLG